MEVLAGQRFGSWTTINITTHGPHTAWVCKCDCGTIKTIIQNALINGKTSRCRRCYLKGPRGPHAFIHKIGDRFGKLVIISQFKEQTEHGPCSMYSMKCDCGNIKIIEAGMLNFLKTQMCRPCALAKRGHSDHGMSFTPTYQIWEGMKRRCHNPKAPKYEYYGGKGIRLCARWHKFENFLEDMGERPTNLVIDRIDSDKDYEPGNCQWITAKENNEKAYEVRMKNKINQ